MTLIATSTDLYKALSTAKHPYYHSSEYEETHEHMSEFLAAWKDYDIDLNRVIRWDIREVKDDFSNPNDMTDEDRRYFGEPGSQYALVHFVAPRKGHTFTHRILNLMPGEVPQLYVFLKKHWEYTQQLWDPLPHIEYVPPTTPRSRFLDRVKTVTKDHEIGESGMPGHFRIQANKQIHQAVASVLGVIDDSYVLLERPEDEDMPLDAGLNIAGELAKTYFADINT